MMTNFWTLSDYQKRVLDEEYFRESMNILLEDGDQEAVTNLVSDFYKLAAGNDLLIYEKSL